MLLLHMVLQDHIFNKFTAYAGVVTHTCCHVVVSSLYTMCMYDSAGCMLLLFVIVTGCAYSVYHWPAHLLPHAPTIWDVTGHA